MVIELVSCYFRYQGSMIGHDEYALQDISLIISSPQILGIIGPNGAGKSTLLYLLSGVVKPLKGSFLVNGINPHKKKTDLLAFQKNLSFISQFPENQFFHNTVYEEITFGLQKLGLSENEIQVRIMSYLSDLGLAESSILGRSPYELGSGEKRLISIAIALVRNPRILILDEPTAGLDVISKCRIWKALRKWAQAQETIFVLVSHELEKLALMPDRLILMDRGRVIEQGGPQEIFSNPQVLLNLNLSFPQMTALGYELKKEGVKFHNWPVFEITDAEAAIKKWLNF